MNQAETIIIGAGIAGLTLARELNKKNKSFIILEKSKGLGGRIATRRIEDKGLDHGALYLKHHPVILDLLIDLRLSSSMLIADEGIYVAEGMTKIPKTLCGEMPVQKEVRAKSIKRVNDEWIVNDSFAAKNLVITAPVPQALELLEENQINYVKKDKLKKINYTKGLLALVIVDEVKNPDLKISEVHSLTEMKQRKLHPNGFVLRASENYSETYFEAGDEMNLKRLLELFHKSFTSPPKILHAELKKWRYVNPLSTISAPFLEVAPCMYLIGDGFKSPDASGAILSAQGLAQKLI